MGLNLELDQKTMEELYLKTKDGYITNIGIKIIRNFDENGKDFNELLQLYFQKCLKS